METTQDRAVVLAVVCFLGALALLGLGGTIWLVSDGRDAAIVTGITGTAVGALGGLLASTRTAHPAVEQAKADAYQQAVSDVRSLAPGGHVGAADNT